MKKLLAGFITLAVTAGCAALWAQGILGNSADPQQSIPPLKAASTGQPAQEIIACAAAGKFDLIVLGSKGRSAMTDLLLGSVANRVVATATQPVAVIK